jgi:hypothetical protein
VPSHTYGAQDGLPALPELTAAHVPVVHVAHGPAQDVLQHTPPTQVPLWHWSAPLHSVPFALLPVQMPAAQLPLEHWSASEHGAPCASFGVQPASLPQ